MRAFVYSLNIVKQCVLNRATWPRFKELTNGTHKDLNFFKNFLATITDGINQEIAEKCNMSLEEATKHVNEFKKSADDYFDNTDIEDEVLTELVDRNDDLRKRYESIVEKNWNDDHQELIDKKKKELDVLQKECEKLSDELNAIKSKKEIKDSEYRKWVKTCDTIKADLDSEVQSKIVKAKDNIASLLTDTIYVGEIIAGASRDSIYNTVSYTKGDEIPSEEPLDDILDVYDLLQDNLKAAGVNESYLKEVSAYLISSFCNNIPFILAGPNGKSIADAFSVTLFGKTAGHIRNMEKYDHRIIDTICESEDKAICIDQFCRSDIVDHLQELISGSEKVLLFLTPYYEDLAIEPIGIYNFAIPLMTELFVMHEPTNEWYGGRGEIICNNYLREEINNKAYGIMKSLGIRNLMKAKYQHLLADSAKIVDDHQGDSILNFIMAYIPFAMMTGQSDALLDYLDNDSKMCDSLNKSIKELVGV